MSDLPVLTFGDFELSARRRTLTQSGRRLRIGSRAMDILLLLADRSGELVTKDEIQARVWPGIFVDDASLRVHLSSLRKAMGSQGAEVIHTVAGRGYIFVPPVARSAEAEPAARSTQPLQLPLRLDRLIGRSAVVESLASQLLERRFVTVVGPGGIGKTSVALEVATRLADDFDDGVRFVDLAMLEDPETAPGSLALTLGLPAVSELTAEALAKPLAGKRLLVVLDNCERLADTAATVAEALLRSTPGICILATSREALRADGEWVHRLPPLATPTVAPTRPQEALKFSAIELFVERAQALSDAYRLSPEECVGIAEICHRLDGLPLAIELAAANLGALGVRGLAAGLDDRLALLTGGKRTAQSRHQTLRAALDWSFDLLTPAEQGVFSRLSVLAGWFDLDLACAVASGAETSPPDVRRIVGTLSRKSLVSTETGASGVRYRLLESSRVYAAEKLARLDGRNPVARRYAEATLTFCKDTERQPAALGNEAWLSMHGARLDDARAALDWCFSEGGDPNLGRTLVEALSPLWMHFGLARECVAWCRKALTGANDIHEMKIGIAFSIAHSFTHGNNMGSRPHMVATLENARRLGDHDYTVRALWGLSTIELNDGRFDAGLDYASQLRDAATGADAAAERLVGERMIGSILHLQGRHAEARTILEGVVEALQDRRLRASPDRFQFDQQVLARGFMAWIEWVQGDPAEARRQIDAALAEATLAGHAGSVGFAIDTGVALAMLDGDLDAAAAGTRKLSTMGSNIGFETWIVRGEVLSAMVQVRSGDLAHGVPRLQAALSPLVWKLATHRTPFFLAELARAEGAAGLPEKALRTIDDAINWFQGADGFWCAPYCFRVKSEVLSLHGGANATREAEALLARASALAQAQGAVGWEARAPAPWAHSATTIQLAEEG